MGKDQDMDLLLLRVGFVWSLTHGNKVEPIYCLKD